MFTNILVIIGSMLAFYPKLEWLFKVSRFIFGLAGGSYGVFCGKYINEVAPPEIKG